LVCSIFALEGHHYYDYDSMPLDTPVSIEDERPEIVDAPLTLISITGQGACGLPLYLQRRPIHLRLMDATMQPGEC
jgi:hypothetical protein